MLLKHLYDLAQSPSRKILDDPAFAPKAVRWIIELDAAGRLLGQGPKATGDDKRGKEFSCPQTIRSKVAGGVAEFLTDGLTSVFGLDPDPEAKMTVKKRADRDANNTRKCGDFWRQVEDAHAKTGRPGMQALLKFKKSLTSAPTFLRWGRGKEAKSHGNPAWWLRTAGGEEVKLRPDNFTFLVNGKLLLEDETIRQCWRETHAKEVGQSRASLSRGLCLVSGRNGVPLAPTHNPKIQGVPNTQSFGAAIVSFDKDAFASYGFDQSMNAPTADDAATAYCVALNWLLDHDDHHVRLGQTTLAFWAREHEQAAGLFARLLNTPDPQGVAKFLQQPFGGITRDLAHRDQFYAVTLAGNAGRIVVRHWLQVPLDDAIENFRRWFADLELFVPPRPPMPKKRAAATAKDKKPTPPLAIFRLACATVREAKDLPPGVPAQLYRAALEGVAPSLALLKPMLDQLHSRMVRDEPYNLLFDESRFALLKLILNRNRKETDMEIRPRLTADTDDPAYNCGRLLAVFDGLQQRAHEWKLEGATVAERYYGSASATPATAFSILWRLHLHHLKKLHRLGSKHEAAAYAIEQKITGISALFGQTEEMKRRRLSPTLPRTLDLQAQGRFALGYYQQKAEDKAGQQAAANDNLTSEPKQPVGGTHL
ncbi:MAG: type I-C CRISPR-associated protein Cas8c/Csd1 [Omnitrophica bacterium RIFCSPHIGHO2_02_FULL_63_14]|nr:MAG: type I-C CRISPR-associated protein Cas8c/Csd1 [Omnitrophica bacterium RIFCSPHIGHO2_02_FULL_63_14]